MIGLNVSEREEERLSQHLTLPRGVKPSTLPLRLHATWCHPMEICYHDQDNKGGTDSSNP